MGADDAWSAEIKRLPFTPHPDPLALDDDLAERLLDGDLPLDKTPPGYAEVAALLAATVAAPHPAELCGLSTTGIAAAATGTLPDPIRDTARRIFATADDTAPMPSTTPGRQPTPSTGDGAAVGAASEGQGARPAGVPDTTAGTAAVNDARCRASKTHSGGDRSNKLNAVTSQAPVEAARDADNDTRQCHKSRPDGTGGNGQGKHPPSDGLGRGQGGEPPPNAGSKPGQGQAGLPPNGGDGSPEKGRPLETGPRRT